MTLATMVTVPWIEVVEESLCKPLIPIGVRVWVPDTLFILIPSVLL
jgi:hypothetical protein